MHPTCAERTPDTAPPRELAALAARQHGVASREQLLGLGLSERQIHTLLARGHLIRLHRSVYAVGHARLTARGNWMAAVLACGPGARLSHRSAAALWDLRRIPSGDIDITAPVRRNVSRVRCHVTRHPERLGSAVIDAIPVTSLERTVLDEASVLHPQRLRSLLEAIERRGRFDLRRFEAELALANGHRGAARLRGALAELGDAAPALRSGLEARMLELIRAAGLPEPSVNVIAVGEVVDLRWPAHGVVVEIDSWEYHRSRRAFENDRRRGNTLALGGETLLRFTDQRVSAEPRAVIAETAAALRRRSSPAAAAAAGR